MLLLVLVTRSVSAILSSAAQGMSGLVQLLSAE